MDSETSVVTDTGTSATPSATRQTPVAVILGRHFVGWALASCLVAFFAFGYRTVTDWLAVLLVVLAAAGVVTGLAALFFTRREAAKSAKNFILVAWAVLGLLAVGAPNGLKNWLSSGASSGFSSASRTVLPDTPAVQDANKSAPDTTNSSARGMRPTNLAFRRDGRADAWTLGGYDDASMPVEELAWIAKLNPAIAEPRAWEAVLAWQRDRLEGGWDTSSALYTAVGIVLQYLPQHGVCVPGKVFAITATQSSKAVPEGTAVTALESDR